MHNQIAQFVKESVEWLVENQEGCCRYQLDDHLAIFVGWSGGYGNCILIDHGNGMKTRYAHLSGYNVKVGDIVTRGEQIGRAGNTGNSTGPHLHFEVIVNGKTKNPINYLS
jgi:murein DD-endopeptidase MepM/ murein hydrolase activator NlpD